MERYATISKLNDMIGEKPIVRLGFDAAFPTLDPFAAMASALDHGGSPCPMLGRRIDRIGSLVWAPYAAAIRRPNARRRDFDAGHRWHFGSCRGVRPTLFRDATTSPANPQVHRAFHNVREEPLTA